MQDSTTTVQTDHGPMIVYSVIAERLGVGPSIHGDTAFWRLLRANCEYGIRLIDEQERQGVN